LKCLSEVVLFVFLQQICCLCLSLNKRYFTTPPPIDQSTCKVCEIERTSDFLTLFCYISDQAMMEKTAVPVTLSSHSEVSLQGLKWILLNTVQALEFSEASEALRFTLNCTEPTGISP